MGGVLLGGDVAEHGLAPPRPAAERSTRAASAHSETLRLYVGPDERPPHAGEGQEDRERRQAGRRGDQFVTGGGAIDLQEVPSAREEYGRLVEDAVAQAEVTVLDLLVQDDVLLGRDAQPVGLLEAPGGRRPRRRPTS